MPDPLPNLEHVLVELSDPDFEMVELMVESHSQLDFTDALHKTQRASVAHSLETVRSLFSLLDVADYVEACRVLATVDFERVRAARSDRR